MRVVLVGSGGREHALGWKLASDPSVDELVSLPGNPGLAELGPTLPGVSPLDPMAVAQACRDAAADLVVIGPEAPLAAGVVDALQANGIPAFGPTRAAARLESSKSFAKEVMAGAGIPTASSRTFTDPAAARGFLSGSPGPYVVKADGLAAGKGVLVTDERSEAVEWVDRCFGGGFGDAGSRVVIEDFLAGPELSVMAICAGGRAVLLPPARDYKRLLDGDRGPNTGGMGAFAPVGLPDVLAGDLVERVFEPTLDAMAEIGCWYTGFLYAGLVLTDAGPQVLEFNCRLGDPETQVLMPLLQSDLAAVLAAATAGDVESLDMKWSDETAVDVVLAAAGYPRDPRRGDAITGWEEPGDAHVFHSGTAVGEGGLVTAGGRVLNVVGVGADLPSARRRAYAAAARISFPGMQARRDIGAE
jgi:phosphoribosylamine--glycine ligase